MAVCAEYRIPHSRFLSWSQEDRDKAIWFQVRQRQTCPQCGTRADEWEGDRNAYVASFHHCRGCEVKARSEDELEKAPEQFPRGTTPTLRPRGEVTS